MNSGKTILMPEHKLVDNKNRIAYMRKRFDSIQVVWRAGKLMVTGVKG